MARSDDARLVAHPRSGAAVQALRVLALLVMLLLLYQGATAGEIFAQVTGMPALEGALALHGGGAIVLHVLTGLTTAAAFWYRASAGGPLWPVVTAAAVFVVTFVQAALGTIATMWVHMPLALAITLAAGAVVAWSWRRT